MIMEGQSPFDFGKILIAVGLMVVLAGVVLILINKLGIHRMPGDLKFGNDNFRVYFPIGTCIVLSVVMTLIMWLIKLFK